MTPLLPRVSIRSTTTMAILIRHLCAASITLLCAIAALPSQTALAAESPQPAESEDTLTIVLPEASKLPSSPGYFCLNASVTLGQRQFPMSFGLFLPASYFTTQDPFPIVVVLHNGGKGLGGVGLTSEGLAALWARDTWDPRDAAVRPNLPAITLRKTARFIGIAPQCPRIYDFSAPPMPRIVSELTTQVGKAYRADPDRAYLTGFSHGGTCSWKIAEQLPDRFAAIAPISARNTDDPQQTVLALKNLPIYLACGSEEWSYACCNMMNDALETTHHPDFIYRPITGGTHWCYPTIYNDPAFWDWLFSKRRKPTAATTGPAPTPAKGHD